MGKQLLTNSSPNTYDDFFKAYEDIKSNKVKSSGMGSLSKQMQSTFVGYNTDVGKSKYDKNILLDADIDENDIQSSINEYRANKQSGIEQIGLGLARASVKAVSEIAKLPGVIGGSIMAIGAENGEGFDTAFNNRWIKSIDQFQDKINTDILPVYTAKAVKEGNLWDNISSTSFWATDGADGLGFIVAMMAPGAVFEYAGLGSKLIQGLSKTSKFVGMVEKTEAGVSTLKYMGITNKNIDSGLAVMGNTIFEAGAEAKSVGDNLDRKKDEFIQKETLKILSNLDNQRRLGQISIEQYNELSQNASLKAEELFKEQRALAMRDTFVSNVGILLGPNALMHKAIWGKAAEKFVKTEKTLGNTFKQIGKNIIQTTASEGFWEEGSQNTIENMNVKKAINRKLSKGFFDNYSIGDFTEEYINTLSTTEGQKAIFLGAALGSPMTVIQDVRQNNKNRKNTNDILNKINQQITNFNTIFDNDVYQKDENGNYIYQKDENENDTTKRIIDKNKLLENTKALHFTEQQSTILDHAIETGDKELVEKIKQQAIFNMVMPAIHNGEIGLKALEQKLNENSKFQELIIQDEKVDNKNKTKEFLKETLDTAKYLQEQNQKFKDFSKDVIELKNEEATDDQKSKFLNKLNNAYLFTKHDLRQNEKNLIILEDKKTKLLEELNINPELNSDNILDNGRLLQDYKIKSPLLTKILEDINLIKEDIRKAKKDISDIWQGNLINESFNDFIETEKQNNEKLSDENIIKADEISEKIKKATSVKNLEEIKTDNPIQQKEIEVKKQEFADAEDAILTQELDNKKEKESLIKNQNLNSLIEMEDTAIDPITGKEGIVMENNENNVIIQTDEGDLIKIDKPKINTDNISSNEETLEVKEQNEDLSSKSNFSLPSKFNDTFKSFVDFMMKPFNKKGIKTSFKLNIENIGTNSQNAVQIYNEALKGKNLSFEDKNLLFNWLPLTVEIENNNSWSGYPGGKSNYSNPDEKFIIRKNIIDLISQGVSLENIKGIVAGQSSPQLNCEFKDNKPVKNKILEIDYVKKLTDNGKDLSKLEVYHVDLESKLIPVSQGAEINPSAKTKELLSTSKGNIYITIKNPLGNDVPVKLNFNRLGEELTIPLLDIYKHILNHTDKELLYTQSLSDLNNEDSQFYNPILYENLKIKLKEVINLLGNKENEITLEQLIEIIILEDSGSNSHLKIVEDENNEYALEFKEGNRYYLSDLNDPEKLNILIKNIAENKYRNIITVPNKTNKTKLSFKNEEYLKYIFNTKALTTNVSTDSYSFKPEESTIWLEPGVTTTQKVKTQLNNQIKNNEEIITDLSTLKKGDKGVYWTTMKGSRQDWEIDQNVEVEAVSKFGIKFKGEKDWKNFKDNWHNFKFNNEVKPKQTNVFDTNLNFKSIKTVVDPDTGESYEVNESLEDLKKQLEIEISNRNKTSIASLKDAFDIRIKEIEEKIRNVQNNSVSLQKDFTMEIEKIGTKENLEIKKTKVENNLSKVEQIKEIEQMVQLNNMLLLNPNLPQTIKDKFIELKNKYSNEFNELPKKCN